MSASAAASKAATSVTAAACSTLERVPRLVEPGRGEVLARLEALVERLRGAQPLDDVRRKRLAGLDVLGVVVEDLGPHDPHLVHLAGELDEVAEHGRAGEVRVRHGGEEPVQRVPELVEEGRHLVERQQRRLTRRRLGDVEVVHDDRVGAAQSGLADERVHPRPAALRVARVEVEHEEAESGCRRRCAPRRRDCRGGTPRGPCAR